MTGQLSLPVCVLPGCPVPVGEWGQPCCGCQAAFGSMLHRNPVGQPLTVDELTSRDNTTRTAHRGMEKH